MSIKVLVISSNAFSKFLNNGKTYESLFKGWLPKNLAQLYFSTIEYPDLSFCDNYYNVTEPDILKSLLTLNLVEAGKVISEKDVVTTQPYIKKENFVIRWIKQNSNNFALFRYLMWKTNLWKNKKLISWIDNYNADLIFFIAGNVIIVHEIVQWINKKKKIPYLVYFTDDYVINKNNKGLFKYLHQKILDTRYVTTINNSSKCYAIGEMMAYDYTEKFKKDFDILVNCIEFNKLPLYKNKKLDSNNITISYIGGLHLNRWKSLIEFGDIIKEVNARMSINCIINVYAIKTPEKNELALLNKFPITFKGALDSEEVLRVIEESDFLVHVESFDKTSRLYTKYSISTKIPEYLSSRKSIIALGPSEVASIKLIQDNNLGLVLTDADSREDQINKILDFFKNPELRTELIDHAYNYAYDNFNAEVIRKRLKEDIIKEVGLINNR